jgi:hypothetical protein
MLCPRTERNLNVFCARFYDSIDRFWPIMPADYFRMISLFIKRQQGWMEGLCRKNKRSTGRQTGSSKQDGLSPSLGKI